MVHGGSALFSITEKVRLSAALSNRAKLVFKERVEREMFSSIQSSKVRCSPGSGGGRQVLANTDVRVTQNYSA